MNGILHGDTTTDNIVILSYTKFPAIDNAQQDTKIMLTLGYNFDSFFQPPVPNVFWAIYRSIGGGR